jgi:hypothetical protein
VTRHATADVDAPAEMANGRLPEAITAQAIPTRIGWLILIEFSSSVQTSGVVTTPKNEPPLSM